jgi:oligopeptide/dipeptide ABC transporter ATP-binding protein
MTAVSARSVSVEALRGRWRQVVEPIDVDVEAGSILGIVGESGAGKTLFTRALVGLLPRGTRAAGTVTLGGQIYDARQGARRALGRDAALVLQNPLTALDPLARVDHQLTEGVRHLRLMTQAAAMDRARELLERLAFTDVDRVLSLYPHQLSGGMAQRVTIALALMPAPKLLIVDEPTSALDASVRVRVLELVRQLVLDQGTAVIFVSHDLSLVGRFCDRLAVMYAGRFVEEGDTASVLGTPEHPYTEALLRCAVTTKSSARGRLESIGGVPPAPEEWPTGCVFAPRCPHAWDTCNAERPGTVEVAPQHVAACHLAPRRAPANDAPLVRAQRHA